ncbi:hypothetical protein DFJ73DRAFT_768117 [Zopfochytrium polystomum]|nr:hypothetical protein DFJ73DRAFT_768117 [Zopfochytrium polystomum]
MTALPQQMDLQLTVQLSGADGLEGEPPRSTTVPYFSHRNRLRVDWTDIIRDLGLSPESHTPAIYPDASLTPIVNGSTAGQRGVTSQEDGNEITFFFLPSCVPRDTHSLELHFGEPDVEELAKAQIHLAKAAEPETLTGQGFRFSSDDVRIACRLSVAAYREDPEKYLLDVGDKWPSDVHSRPHFVRCGDRSSRLHPYVLAMTSAMGESPCGIPGQYSSEYATHEERTLWVAFRGTDNLKDVISDLKIMQSATDLGRVHGGFWATIDELSEHLKSISSALRETNVHLGPGQMRLRVIFTGHSLGGALAQPWVANHKTAESLESRRLSSRLLTVVNDDDIVPRLLDYAEVASSISTTVQNAVPAARDICTFIGAFLGDQVVTSTVETLVKAVATIANGLDRFPRIAPQYAPLGHLLVIKKKDSTNEFVSEMLKDSKAIRQWVGTKLPRGSNGMSILENGIIPHKTTNYRHSVDSCKNLNLVPGEKVYRSNFREFVFESNPKEFLLPKLESCNVVLAANRIRVILKGENLQFLNVNHPDFFDWDFSRLAKGEWKVESLQPTYRTSTSMCASTSATPVMGNVDKEELPNSTAYLSCKVEKKNPDAFDITKIDSPVDEGVRSRMTVEFFEAAVFRLYFKLCHAIIFDGENGGEVEDLVSDALKNSPSVAVFHELCSALPPIPRAPHSRIEEFNAALKSALVSQVSEAKKYSLKFGLDRNALIFFSGTTRDTLKKQIRPVLEAIVLELSKVRSYEYKSSLVVKGAKVINKVVQVDRYAGIAVLAVVLGAAAFIVGIPAAPLAVAELLEVGVADLAVGAAANDTEMEMRYRKHIGFLIDSLGSDSTKQFSFRQLEDELHKLLIDHGFEDVAQANESAPKWLSEDKQIKLKLEGRHQSKMFEPTNAKVPTLKNCKPEAKFAALRFLRLVMCVRETRRLMDSTFISFIGESAVGKSSLLKALFDLDITAGLGDENRTKNVSLYPLAEGKEVPISVLDYPGTTDTSEDASVAFYETHGMMNMHVILTPVDGGSTGLREIADRLRGLPLRMPEANRRDAEAQNIMLPAASTHGYEGLISTPVCVLVSKLDSVPGIEGDGDKEIEKIKRQVAALARVRDTQVHVFWNETVWKDSGPLPSRKHLVNRGIDSVRRFLCEQLLDQLNLKNYEAEVKAQLKLQTEDKAQRLQQSPPPYSK